MHMAIEVLPLGLVSSSSAPAEAIPLYRRSLAFGQPENAMRYAMPREWQRVFERVSTTRHPGIQRIALDSSSSGRVDLYWVDDTVILRLSNVGALVHNYLQSGPVRFAFNRPSAIAFINNTRLVCHSTLLVLLVSYRRNAHSEMQSRA